MADLLVDFIAQILHARQVLARIGDAALGLAASLLIERNAGRFFDESAHVIGACLDYPRDHALLDDGVAARAEAGAQEQLRDVLATAAATIDEIAGGAIARHHPLERDFAVAGIGAADLAIGVVEHQFDRGGTDRLA